MEIEERDFASPFPPDESSAGAVADEHAFVDPDDDEDCRAGLVEFDGPDDDE